MREIKLEIEQIRNIHSAKLVFPFEKGLYALVGENGCGKSTIMLLLSLLIKKSSTKLLRRNDMSNKTCVKLSVSNTIDVWKFDGDRLRTSVKKYYQGRLVYDKNNNYSGFYEGSIFYGSRFNDYSIIDNYQKKANLEMDLIDADDFVRETLGYILHDDIHYYSNLKKIRNRKLAEENNFKGMPYFLKKDNYYISQYSMSSGESMLISLIDFINNLVIRKSNKNSELLFLIDEIELALHPGAIDRLLVFLKKLVKTSDITLTIYFSTHSSEILHHISPKNIYLINNLNGIIDCQNPCYPNYVIRNLYIPNGYDFLILVEDELAKKIVENVINRERVYYGKLCCVIPSGGWDQMLKLHNDIIKYNILGIGKKVISIYDGDVETDVRSRQEYNNLPKSFLPIPSVEKFMYNKLIKNYESNFVKYIGDRFFTLTSIDSVIKEYNNEICRGDDNNGKKLYKLLLTTLNKINKSEESLIESICTFINDTEKTRINKFANNLRNLLS